MSAIHFYDAITAGKSAPEGQIVRYDSLLLELGNAIQSLELNVALREDVHVDFDAAADSELAGMDLLGGVSELEWVKVAHDHFSKADCLHVGFGNTTRIDPYIRYGIYRNLLPYPCVGLPPGSRFLDLETVLRAIALLRPEEYPWLSGPDPAKPGALHHFLMWDLKVGGGNRAFRIRNLLGEAQGASPKLVSHAISQASVASIKTALGLDQGEVSDLDSAVPSVLVHPSLQTNSGFVIGMPVGIDITYPDILFVADLQADLSVLCDPGNSSYQDLVRQTSKQMNRPLVRVPLSRFPFCAPLRVVRPDDAQRLRVDIAQVKHNISLIRSAGFIPARLKEAPVLELASQPSDVYHRMWAGEFSHKDQALMTQLHASTPSDWLKVAARANDTRFYDLAVRMLGRAAPALLASNQLEECSGYARSRCPTDFTPPLWVAELVKQAQDTGLVHPAAVGLLQLHERFARNIG